MMGCSMPNSSVMAVFTYISRCDDADGSVNDFEETRGAHAAAQAHGDNSIFGLAPPSLDQGVAGKTRTGHAIGMADGDRAAIDVQLFRIDAELVAAVDHLHRECLVQFPQIDVVDGKAMTF